MRGIESGRGGVESGRGGVESGRGGVESGRGGVESSGGRGGGWVGGRVRHSSFSIHNNITFVIQIVNPVLQLLVLPLTNESHTAKISMPYSCHAVLALFCDT